jgi:hypothetical protein
MQTYSNKSNAKRAGIKAIVKNRGVAEVEVKANPAKFFTIEGNKESGFHPHYLTDRVGVVSGEKEVELKVERKKINAKLDKSFPIEKDRPEQNGIRRPSAGGKCRAIWDACDTMQSEGGMPAPKTIKALAGERGWNVNNAIIEMYQWRKFNGIAGRQK